MGGISSQRLFLDSSTLQQVASGNSHTLECFVQRLALQEKLIWGQKNTLPDICSLQPSFENKNQKCMSASWKAVETSSCSKTRPRFIWSLLGKNTSINELWLKHSLSASGVRLSTQQQPKIPKDSEYLWQIKVITFILVIIYHQKLQIWWFCVLTCFVRHFLNICH